MFLQFSGKFYPLLAGGIHDGCFSPWLVCKMHGYRRTFGKRDYPYIPQSHGSHNAFHKCCLLYTSSMPMLRSVMPVSLEMMEVILVTMPMSSCPTTRSVMAVSYTHLDVYKRQRGRYMFVWKNLLYRTCGNWTRMQPMPLAIRPSSSSAMKSRLPIPTTVSACSAMPHWWLP